MKIGIVTDSTADMPPDYYEKNNVVMVPLEVRFGDETFRDWIDIKPDEFYERMRSSSVIPKTSQPSAGDFIKAYTDLAQDCDRIISIHISSKLSGTIQSAQAACQEFKDVPVTLIDSEVTSLLLGGFVQELVKARDAGGSLEELSDLAETCKRQGKLIFVVDTLKYLELGGRIGKAKAILGSLLSVKPILSLEDGVVVPMAQVKGTRKARKELISLVAQEVEKRQPDKKPVLTVARTDNPEVLEQLKVNIDEAGIPYSDIKTGTVGAVIGTYTGPGTYAVSIL